MVRVVHANDGLLVAGNIFSGPGTRIENYSGKIHVRHNLVRNVTDYFVNAAKGDLHLKTTAADAIGKAPALDGVDADFDGQKRGDKPDLGADELVAEE